METGAYLDRIGFTEPVKPDARTLRGLQTAHMRNVPFENLDIELKRPIRLDEGSLWKKIVVEKRGGFCYELNGLFAWLLKQIGFHVTYLNALSAFFGFLPLPSLERSLNLMGTVLRPKLEKALAIA